MTAPAKLNLSKEQLWQIKLLAKGQTSWEELDFEEKKMIYDTGFDLSYRVSNEELNQFERKLAMKGEFGISGIAKAAVEEAANRITP